MPFRSRSVALASKFRRLDGARGLLLGPAFLRHQRLIRDSKSWTRSDAERYWNVKKRQIGYHEVFPNLTSKADISSRAVWLKPPFTSRLTSYSVSTAGTTGDPFAFYRDRFWARQKERAYLFDIWRSVAYAPFDLRVVFKGNFHKKVFQYNVMQNCVDLSPNALRNDLKADILRYLKGLPPFFFDVSPSSLFALMQFLGERNIGDLPVRGVLIGSEILPASQMDYIRQRHGLDIAHWYGHSEYGILAKYRKKRDEFEFYPTYGLVEFDHLEANLFAIIATSFNRCGTRFVRYRTGDVAELEQGKEKDVAFVSVKRILGREQEYFYDREGIRHSFGSFLFGMHWGFWNVITDIQFRQNKVGHMDVFIAPRGKKKASLEDFLEQRFSNVSLCFHHVTRIDKDHSEKHRYFVGMETGPSEFKPGGD